MIRKVPLKQFVNFLIRIYEQGYDFVDLSYKTEGDRDVVAIQVLSDYISDDDEEEDEDEEFNDTPSNNINFDDLV